MSTKKNVEFKLNTDFKSSEEGVLPILPTFQNPGINRKRLRIAITSVAGSVMAVALAFVLLMQSNILPVAAAVSANVTPAPVAVSIKGIDGLDGKDGVDGKNGYNGKSGKNGANGMSAYQIAVKNGFTGSEQEWINQTTAKITEATAKTDELQKQIDDNKKLIDDAIKNGNAELAKELEEKNKDLQNQLDKSLAELKALLDKLNSRTDGLESSINYINSTNIDIQKQITINKQLLEESIKNGNTDLQKQLEAKNAELQAQLDKNLAELQALLDKLGTRTDSLEDSVAVINSKNAEIKQEIDDNKALIDKAIADGNAELQKELEEKNNSLQAKFNANLSELQAENELLKGEVSALQGRIKSMEDENRSVLIDPVTKNWIVGGVDTGVSSQGAGMEDGWAIGTIRNSAPSGITSSNWRQVKDTKTTTTPTTRCIGTLYHVRDIGDGGDVKYIYVCRACGVSQEFNLGSGSQEGTTCGRMIGNDEICHVYSVDSLSAAQVDKLASRTLDPLNLPISAAGKYIYVGRPD